MRHLLIAASLLALNACGSGDTVAVPDGKGGTITVKRDGEKASYTDSDGNITTVDSSPSSADFPAFAPQYPGSKIESAASIGDDEKHSQILNLLTSDDSQKVRDFYKAAFEKGGKKISEVSADGNFLLSTEDEDPGSLITIAPDEEGRGTTISMVLNSKK